MRNTKIIWGSAAVSCIGLVFLAAGPAAQSQSQAQTPVSAPAVTVLHCGHLLDSIGGKLLGATTVVVAGKRVQEVQSGTTTALAATEIDLRDQT